MTASSLRDDLNDDLFVSRVERPAAREDSAATTPLDSPFYTTLLDSPFYTTPLDSPFYTTPLDSPFYTFTTTPLDSPY